MSTIKRIRKSVFKLRQDQFATIAGVHQATVSKWESGELIPDMEKLQAIRNEAIARGLEWSDSWFFIGPAVAGAQSLERNGEPA